MTDKPNGAIRNAKTKIFLDGQEVYAHGITSTDEYLVLEDAEVPPILGRQTVCITYPGGQVWSMVCECRIELTENGLENRYFYE